MFFLSIYFNYLMWENHFLFFKMISNRWTVNFHFKYEIRFRRYAFCYLQPCCNRKQTWINFTFDSCASAINRQGDRLCSRSDLTDPEDMTLELDFAIPEMRIRGAYKVEGLIATVSLGGRGPFTVNASKHLFIYFILRTPMQ